MEQRRSDRQLIDWLEKSSFRITFTSKQSLALRCVLPLYFLEVRSMTERVQFHSSYFSSLQRRTKFSGISSFRISQRTSAKEFPFLNDFLQRSFDTCLDNLRECRLTCRRKCCACRNLRWKFHRNCAPSRHSARHVRRCRRRTWTIVRPVRDWWTKRNGRWNCRRCERESIIICTSKGNSRVSRGIRSNRDDHRTNTNRRSFDVGPVDNRIRNATNANREQVEIFETSRPFPLPKSRRIRGWGRERVAAIYLKAVNTARVVQIVTG